LKQDQTAAFDVQPALPFRGKLFQAKANTIPGSPNHGSASRRNPVRLQPGMLFGIIPESCSASPRNPVRIRADSAESSSC